MSGKTIANLIDRARQSGFKVWILYLFLDHPDTNIDRIKIRVRSGGHHVPDGDVVRKFYRSKDNFWNIFRAMTDQWLLYGNTSGDASKIKIHEDELFALFKKGIS